MQDDPCRLYLITPPRIEPAAFAETLAAALDGGDVAALQLRLKDCGRDEILAAAEILLPIVHSHDVAFLMNDDPALAAEAGCDGVHVGQEDASYQDARAILGDQATIGVTCHGSVEEMDKVSMLEDTKWWPWLLPTHTLEMGWCIKCHRENDASQDCYTCHY